MSSYVKHDYKKICGKEDTITVRVEKDKTTFPCRGIGVVVEDLCEFMEVNNPRNYADLRDPGLDPLLNCRFKAECRRILNS